jgi:hypothetical protein
MKKQVRVREKVKRQKKSIKRVKKQVRVGKAGMLRTVKKVGKGYGCIKTRP